MKIGVLVARNKSTGKLFYIGDPGDINALRKTAREITDNAGACTDGTGPKAKAVQVDRLVLSDVTESPILKRNC